MDKDGDGGKISRRLGGTSDINRRSGRGTTLEAESLDVDIQALQSARTSSKNLYRSQRPLIIRA